MQPSAPIYVVSKGRADTRLTVKALERMRVPYRIIVEEQEREMYEAVIEPSNVLVLDPKYQAVYDTFDDLGDTKSKGPGAARNFAWDHSIEHGHAWHWVMDDNIREFYRLNRNHKVPLADGTGFAVMEAFAQRFRNVGMAGPNYAFFAKRKQKLRPFITNTRIYSCNLIRNDVPMRWRGRYNEDTDLSLRMLKSGWCTIQFNAYLQSKMRTQTMNGGNTAEFYADEGTRAKSEMQVRMHPDVSRVTHRFGRKHHFVDYTGFQALKLWLRDDIDLDAEANEFGMMLRERATGREIAL